MKMQKTTTRGTTHAVRMIGLVCATAIVLSACSQADTERANQAAEVILTQSADATPQASDATPATSTSSSTTNTTVTADTNTPLPPGVRITATPSLVYARCLVRQATEMRALPNEAATVVIALAARDIFTAYGRTIDAGWVLGWRNDQAFGWAPAAGLGCTVPIAELMPTEPNVLLLTPTGVAVAQVDATAAPTPTVAPVATTAEATQASVSTATTAPVPSPAPVTDTPIPPTKAPTLAPTEMQPLPTQTPFVVIQIVTVVVTVTVPAIEIDVTATPLLTPAPTPAPTIAPTLEPTAEAITAQGLACKVTPGTPVNFRRGPSRADRLIGTLRAGTPLIAQGRNDDGTWLYGLGPRSTSGWLIASSVACNGDMTALPVVDR